MRDIKKLASNVSKVAGSALLVGATLAGAAGMAAAQSSGSSGDLGDYPHPFVDEDGNVDTQVVVGEDAKTSDVVGAIDIAGSLGNAALASEEKTVSGASAGWSATNGDTVSTENTQVYFSQDLSTNGLQTTMTEDELSVLESGTVEVDNDDHNYDQYVNLNTGLTSLLGDSGGDLDDSQLITNLGTSAGSAYTATVTFDSAVNMTDAADDDADLRLFGVEYSVGDESDVSQGGKQLILFGSQETESVSEGESQTITVDGTEVSLETDSVTGDDSANVVIDGELESGVQEGDSFTVDSVDEEIRIDQIVYRGDLNYGERGRVIFSVGSQKLTLEQGSEVMVGSEEEEIDNTNVKFNGNTGSSDVDADVSKIEVEVAAQDDEEDHLAEGEQFEDPVFGTFSLAFGGSSPAPEADSRSTIEASTSSDDTGTLTVTDDNGNEETFNLATDSDTDNSNAPGDLSLYSDDYNWVLQEGANMTEDDRFVVNRGDFTHVLEVSSIEGDDNEDEVQFDDVFTGATYTATVDGSGQDSIFIDGQEYFVNVNSGHGVEVTWDSSASAGSTGDAVTVFPYFQDENDAEVAVTAPDVQLTGVMSGDNLELPTGTVSDSDLALTFNNGTAETTTEDVGTVEYRFEETADSGSGGSTVNVSITDQSSSELNKPAALVVEEEDDDNNQNAVVLSYGDDSDGITAASPTFTDSNADTGKSLDNDDTISMDLYGTYSVHDSDDGEFTRVHYPDAQATVGFGVVSDGELSSSGGAGSVMTHSPTGWPDVGMLDSDVTSSHRANSNMILVGGPVVNDLVSDLASENKTWSADQYSQGQGLIHLVEDAFSEGNDALVVAGQNRQDTREAASYISNYADHQDDLSGETQVTLNTAQSQSAQ